MKSLAGSGEDLLQTARCEDSLYEQIRDVSVIGVFERRILDALKGSGANLLEGARGVGKSMLLRMAEIELARWSIRTRSKARCLRELQDKYALGRSEGRRARCIPNLGKH
jgi:hypothetical protein